MIWSLIQRLGKQAINIGFMLWLALVLSPEDFGALAICLVWIGLAKLFVDLGFPLAIIRYKDANEQHLSSLFVFNILAGTMLYVMFGIILYFTNIITSSHEYRFAYLVLAVTIVIDSVSTVFRAVLQKHLLFKRLAYRDITAALVSGVIGISLAYNGYEVWSLIWQSITVSVVGAAILWKESDWRPKIFDASLTSLKDLWGFASSMTGAEMLKYVSQNYQILTIVYLFDQRVAGLFVFSWKFSILLFKEPVKAIDAYLFPRFSMEQERIEVLRHLYLHTVKILSYLAFPVTLLYATIFPIFILTYYGDKWVEAAGLIKILSVAAFSYVYISVSTSLKKALGRGAWVIGWIGCFVGAMIVAIWIGHFWGLTGVVVAISTIHVFGVLFAVHAAMKELSVSLRAAMWHFGPLGIVMISTVMMIYFLTSLLGQSGLHGPSLDISLCIAGVITYLYVMHLVDPGLNREVWKRMQNQLKSSFAR